tara:strand:- start:284 stop:490 length:207 start_codon:yes stop_codon:yes gene_type:complete
MVSAIVGFTLFQRKKYQAKVVPSSAHNRAVFWYQQIMTLPPEERTPELAKWREFTQDLETDNTLMRIK